MATHLPGAPVETKVRSGWGFYSQGTAKAVNQRLPPKPWEMVGGYRGNLPPSLEKEQPLLTSPLWQGPGASRTVRTRFCCLSQLVCSVLLWQPLQSNTLHIFPSFCSFFLFLSLGSCKKNFNFGFVGISCLILEYILNTHGYVIHCSKVAFLTLKGFFFFANYFLFTVYTIFRQKANFSDFSY